MAEVVPARPHVAHRRQRLVKVVPAHAPASTTNFATEQCIPASFQPAECQR